MFKQRLFGIALAAATALLLLSPGKSEANFFGWGGWGGYYPNYAYSGYYGYGWGNPGYYGYGWGYPGYSYYSYPNYGSYSYPSYYSYPTYSSPYAAVPQTNQYQSFYYSPESANTQDQLDKRIRVEVQVPRDAELWFDGHKTQQTGTDRQFLSPPIVPNYNYSYDIRARWLDNGRPVERTRTVNAQAGQQVRVDFLRDQPNDKPREVVPAPQINK
jgi:uncharacterized protein (TIGR03000 family)